MPSPHPSRHPSSRSRQPSGPPLPIDAVLDDIRTALTEDGRVVVTAAPGAGKTTRVPLALVDAPWREGGRIVLLEPRRVAARAAATFMARSLGEQLGQTVGLTTREDRRVSDRTVVEVVTEGVLVRRLQRDVDLPGVSCVLLDEFHERSLDADLALALTLEVRDLLRPELRVGVLSATIDTAAIADLLGGSPVVRSEGRAYPVDIENVDTAPLTAAHPRDVGGAIADAIRDALDRHEGDVLAFLPGVREIGEAAAALRRPDVEVVPLHGRLPAREQDRALTTGTRRRVVLATDLAESSVTVPGVRIVVDAGLAREPRLDPRLGMTRLVTVAASRASADQRAGRAGRVAPGHAIRLWPSRSHGARPAWPTPEIRAADLTALALALAAWGAEPEELRLLDSPPGPAWQAARATLAELGCLDDAGRITDHGRRLARLPAHPRLGHLLVAGAGIGLGDRAARVAALLGERDLVRVSRDRPDTDLATRVAVLAGQGARPRSTVNEAVLRRVRDDAKRLGRMLRAPTGAPTGQATGPAVAADLATGALVALAWPDRVARRRPGRRGAYLLANGRGGLLDDRDPLANEEWLAVADVDAGQVDARIHRAAALDLDTVRQVLADRIETVDRVEWDEESGTVVAQREERLGAIVLSSAPLATDEIEPQAALLAGVRARGLKVLRWSDGARSLQARVTFLHRVLGDPWPNLSDQRLLDTLDEWLAPFLLGGIRRLGDLGRVDVTTALRSRVPHDLLRRLDELAPTHVRVPSGSSIRLDYSGDEPVLAVKLQEMFGAATTPTVAGGKAPVVVHLLSPAGRPLQVTRDLAGFWDGTYAAVRAEMRGRYPKHAWPENPREVVAHRGTKRNARRVDGGRGE